VFDFGDRLDGRWGDLRIEGYIAGRQVIVKNYSGKGINQDFMIVPDDTWLFANDALKLVPAPAETV
jgi:beta-galactosidase